MTRIEKYFNLIQILLKIWNRQKKLKKKSRQNSHIRMRISKNKNKKKFTLNALKL